MESCIGCGAKAEAHPWVGIGQVLKGPLSKPDGKIASHPICEACQQEPEHRSRCRGVLGLRLKLHYFPRAQEKRALLMAGRAKIGD